MIKKINLKQTIHVTHNLSFANCTCKFQENTPVKFQSTRQWRGSKDAQNRDSQTGDIRNQVLGTVWWPNILHKLTGRLDRTPMQQKFDLLCCSQPNTNKRISGTQSPHLLRQVSHECPTSGGHVWGGYLHIWNGKFQ